MDYRKRIKSRDSEGGNRPRDWQLAAQLLNTRLKDITLKSGRLIGVDGVRSILETSAPMEIEPTDYETYCRQYKGVPLEIEKLVEFDPNTMTVRDYIGLLASNQLFPTASIEGLRWIKEKTKTYPIPGFINDACSGTFGCSGEEYTDLAIALDDFSQKKATRLQRAPLVMQRNIFQHYTNTTTGGSSLSSRSDSDVEDTAISTRLSEICIKYGIAPHPENLPPYMHNKVGLVKEYVNPKTSFPRKRKLQAALEKLIAENEPLVANQYQTSAEMIQEDNTRSTYERAVNGYLSEGINNIIMSWSGIDPRKGRPPQWEQS